MSGMEAMDNLHYYVQSCYHCALVAFLPMKITFG